MQLRDDLGMFEHDFRHEGAGLQVAAPLELEQVALGADHGALVEALEKGQVRSGRGGHGVGGVHEGVEPQLSHVLGGTHPAPRR